MFGERIRPSPYRIKFNEQQECQSLCVKKYTSDDDKMKFLKHGMMFSYEHHWIIDNMPVAWCYDVEGHKKYCAPGFPMGCFVTKDGKKKDACVISDHYSKPNTFYVFNHVDITILYHEGAEAGYEGNRLVQARVVPRSFDHSKGLGHLLELVFLRLSESFLEY